MPTPSTRPEAPAGDGPSRPPASIAPPSSVAPPPSVAPPAALPPLALALRAEVEADGDRSRQAVLLHEIASVLERGGGADAQAVREYLSAYNLDPAFRPPLFALLRIFERRRAFKNLGKLYEAALKSATSGEERAAALLDRAALLSDHIGQPDAEPALLEQACEEDGESTAAPLWLEWRIRQTGGDPERLAWALQLRATRARDPRLKALLLRELAALRERAGDVDGAIETLSAASRSSEGRDAALEALEAVARRQRRDPALVMALEAKAGLLAWSPERGADAASSGLEAARLRRERLGDARGARETIEKALEHAPDDLALLWEHMLACEADGDVAAAASDAARVLAAVGLSGGSNRHAAPLRFRLAEAAQLAGDPERALSELRQAAAEAPGSAVIAATLADIAIARGEVAPVVDALKQDAVRWRDAGANDAAAAALHGAASWLRAGGGDARGAHALLDEALALGPSAGLAARLRRDRLFSAEERAPEEIAPVIEDALAWASEAPDASIVIRAALHLAAPLAAQEDPAAADREASVRLRRLLELALRQPEAAEWGADAARLFAAEFASRGGPAAERAAWSALLVGAHERMAERAEGAELAAAHLTAAARAAARGALAAGVGASSGAADGALDEAAVRLLKRALERVPGHPYALALLEELHRRRGDSGAVVQILRELASGDRTGEGALTPLLAAGAEAEAGGDLALAAATYREAAELSPDAAGPLEALERLWRRGEPTAKDLPDRAAAREARLLSAGAPVVPWASLERGEAAWLAAPGGGLDDLRRALAAEPTRVPAALALALCDDPAARSEGLRALAAEESVPAGVLHAWRADAVVRGVDPRAFDEALARGAQPDRTALLLRWWQARPGTVERAEAAFALAEATEDDEVAAELVLAGIRAGQAARLAGNAYDDDAALRAAELVERAPGSLAAAVAYAEAFADVDDAAERAEALGRIVGLLEGTGASADDLASLRGEHARAMVAAGRAEEVIETLMALTEDPDDLAAFETMRVAGREVGAYRLVVKACQRLAEAAAGELRAQLLEEGAAVLMDHLERDDEAEPLLRAALAIAPTRPIAYARLHDLLAYRGDDAALLELVVARTDATDDPDALVPLFYEEARLRRGLGQREEALAALDNLFLLEGEHVGGLALLVELQVQREAWEEVVDGLRRLAGADVPPAQKRIAHLGAADFLEKRLDRPRDAIAELEAIETLGLGDAALTERLAALAERAGVPDRAREALQRGAASAASSEAAALHRRRGALEEREGDLTRAAQAYRDALLAIPGDPEAAEALARVTGSRPDMEAGR
jgi:hypothetical protein